MDFHYQAQPPEARQVHEAVETDFALVVPPYEFAARQVHSTRIRPTEFLARVLAYEVCVQICLKGNNQHASELLADGARMLREALALWDILFKPLAPHHECIQVTWEDETSAGAPDRGARPKEFMQTMAHMRLQVQGMAAPPLGVAQLGAMRVLPPFATQVYTVQLAVSGSAPASVQLTPGGTTPLDAPSAAAGARQAGQMLSIKVFAMGGQEPVAEALVPLELAWKLVVGNDRQGVTGPPPSTPWAHSKPSALALGPAAAFRKALDPLAPPASPSGRPPSPTPAAQHTAKRCPFCNNSWAKLLAALCGWTCKYCKGTQRSPDVTARQRSMRAFGALLPEGNAGDADGRGRRWWLEAAQPGARSHVRATLHVDAFLTNFRRNLWGRISIRLWKVEEEVPVMGMDPSQMPMPSPVVPSNHLQLSVMHLYKVSLEAALQCSNCGPRKLHLDQPWLWLMGEFIRHHTLQGSAVHLVWLQWYLRDDVVSRTPVALRLINEKLELLSRIDLDSCERTQLDHLRQRALLLVAATFRRYYRLEDAMPLGVCDPHERSKEKPPEALEPAYCLASQLKDLSHPQEQEWLRDLLSDAAEERWQHLVPVAGLRAHGDAKMAPAKLARKGEHGVQPSCPSFLDVMHPTHPSKREPRQRTLQRGLSNCKDVAQFMATGQMSKDQLTVSIGNLCRLVMNELSDDLDIQHANVLPSFVCLPVLAAEVYCNNLSSMIVYVLDTIKPDPTPDAKNAVVEMGKLEMFLEDRIYDVFKHPQPFSAHNLLESTVNRWLLESKAALMNKLHVEHTKQQSMGPHGGASEAEPAPGCAVQRLMLRNVRAEVGEYEIIVTHLPRTVTAVEIRFTEVVREMMLVTCRLQGLVRKRATGAAVASMPGAMSPGVEIALDMRQKGWSWDKQSAHMVSGSCLYKCEIIMLNSLRRLLSDVAQLDGQLRKWSGVDSMPPSQQPAPTPRVGMFTPRVPDAPLPGPRHPPKTLDESLTKLSTAPAAAYRTPSAPAAHGGRPPPAHEQLQHTPGAYQRLTAAGIPVPGGHHLGLESGHGGIATGEAGGPPYRATPPRPYPRGSPAEHSRRPTAEFTPVRGPTGKPPYGAHTAQLVKEIRHIYSFAVIETATRLGRLVFERVGSMHDVIMHTSDAAAAAHGYQGRLHGGAGGRATPVLALQHTLEGFLQGIRSALEDKAFIALTRGIWDFVGNEAFRSLSALADGRENPTAWRTRQGAEQLLMQIEEFFKQGLQQRCPEASLVAKDLVPPSRFASARDLVSSTQSVSYQPI